MQLDKLLQQYLQLFELTEEESFELFQNVLSTNFSEAQLGAFLLASHFRNISKVRHSTAISEGEINSHELLGATKALQSRMIKIDTIHLKNQNKIVDTCGTGGSGLNSFNTSTVAALILAASGIKVAKHGNRAASSKSGSADLLEALGICIGKDFQVNNTQSAEKIISSLNKHNFTFLFAPNFHPALVGLAPIRRQLGLKTIFNLLGPLLNPLQVKHQLVGLNDLSLHNVILDTLLGLGHETICLVTGQDGLDEVTLTTRSHITLHQDKLTKKFIIDPQDFGFALASPEEIQSHSPEFSKEKTLEILQGKKNKFQELVVLNAALALFSFKKVKTIQDGIILSNHLLTDGTVLKLVENLKKVA